MRRETASREVASPQPREDHRSTALHGWTRSAGITRANHHLAWSLAAIAGALNAAGFYDVGLYASNMTGNVSAAAEHLALADLPTAVSYLFLVLAFLSGAAVSTLLINVGRRYQIAGIHALGLVVEAMLLVGLGCFDLWLRGSGRDLLLVHGLSFLMGLQNGVVTQVSDARVRTTHVTGMMTDIGIELGNLLVLAWHVRKAGDRSRATAFNKGKLGLHGFTAFSFLAGGVVGVAAYQHLGAFLLFGLAVLLLIVAPFAAPVSIGRRRLTRRQLV